MAQSKKISLGFRVINTRTGEALSETFKKRDPARAIAARLYQERQIPTGVEHIYDYVAKGTKRTASLRRAQKRAKATRRTRRARKRLRKRLSRRSMSLPRVPRLEAHSGSWIVSRIKDGSVIGEFYDRRNVEKFNPATCRIETAAQYLGRVNREIKRA